MLFSVVIPVYNIEGWLDKCVKSILNQTCKDYEILLIDDGSKDSSGQMCDWYQENYHNIRAVHKENGGLSDARNYGVTFAKGEYLLFIDGDDYIAEWTLEKISHMIRNEFPDVILSEGMYYVQDGKAVLKKTFCAEKVHMISGKDAILYTSAISSDWSACDKCYRTAFWREHGYQFCKDRLAEDMQLIDKVVLQAEKVCMIPTFYYYQRTRGDSIMNNVNVRFMQDILKNLNEWEEYFRTASLDEKIVCQLRALHAKTVRHAIWGYLYFVDDENRERLLNESKPYVEYLRYSSLLELKLVRILIRLIGLKNTCFLLGSIKKRRNKNG